MLLGGAEKRRTLTGYLSFTSGKVLKLHDVVRKNVTVIRPSRITAMDVAVEKESVEDEWTWKEMGDDEKIRTGRTYPDRMYVFTVTLSDGKKHTGHLLGTPVYVTGESGECRRVILRTHQRGAPGTKLGDLVYVAGLAFHDEDAPPPWPLKKEDTEAKDKKDAGTEEGKDDESGSEVKEVPDSGPKKGGEPSGAPEPSEKKPGGDAG